MTAVLPEPATRDLRAGRYVPGEVGIWVFVLGDMLAFTLFFVSYFTLRGGQPEVFSQGREALNMGFGLGNTALLLTSSLLVAWAVRSMQAGVVPHRWLLSGALACGSLFGVNKVVEYSGKSSAGLTLTTNDFFMLFYMFTGIHLLHVIIGMVALACMVRVSKRSRISASGLRAAENGATYWHMVDLLWIVLFSLFYLVG